MQVEVPEVTLSGTDVLKVEVVHPGEQEDSARIAESLAHQQQGTPSRRVREQQASCAHAQLACGGEQRCEMRRAMRCMRYTSN